MVEQEGRRRLIPAHSLEQSCCINPLLPCNKHKSQCHTPVHTYFPLMGLWVVWGSCLVWNPELEIGFLQCFNMMDPPTWDVQQEWMAPFLTTSSFQNEWLSASELLCFRMWVKFSSALHISFLSPGWRAIRSSQDSGSSFPQQQLEPVGSFAHTCRHCILKPPLRDTSSSRCCSLLSS